MCSVTYLYFKLQCSLHVLFSSTWMQSCLPLLINFNLNSLLPAGICLFRNFICLGYPFFILPPKGTVSLFLTISYISWRQKHMDPPLKNKPKTKNQTSPGQCSAFYLPFDQGSEMKHLHSELLPKRIYQTTSTFRKVY